MNIEVAIYKALKELGMPTSLLGYAYIRDAVLLIEESPEAIRQMTRAVYPAIAAKNNTTQSRAERAIRHAIEYVYDNTDPEVIQRFFGNTGNLRSGKLTNTQFISGLLEYIKMEVMV